MSITLPGHTRTRLHRIKHVGKLVQIQISRTQLANSRIALKSQLVPQDTAGHYALCLKSNASLEIKMQVALEKLQRYVQFDAIIRTYVARRYGALKLPWATPETGSRRLHGCGDWFGFRGAPPATWVTEES